MADPTYNLNGGFKPTMKRFADLEGPDFFPTPRWATFALIDNEKFSGDVWEFADATLAFLREKVPRNWPDLCDSVTDNFRVINPKDFRVVT